MVMNPVYLIVLGIIGIVAIVMAYFAQLALFSPEKLRDYTHRQYERLPGWWPARDLNLRMVDTPSSFIIVRTAVIAGFVLVLAVFIFLLIAPGLAS